MSLAEIKSAVDTLSLEELAELATFIRERDQAAWDRQIDEDFAADGRLSSVAEEVRADIRAGICRTFRDRQSACALLEALRCAAACRPKTRA